MRGVEGSGWGKGRGVECGCGWKEWDRVGRRGVTIVLK